MNKFPKRFPMTPPLTYLVSGDESAHSGPAKRSVTMNPFRAVEIPNMFSNTRKASAESASIVRILMRKRKSEGNAERKSAPERMAMAEKGRCSPMMKSSIGSGLVR